MGLFHDNKSALFTSAITSALLLFTACDFGDGGIQYSALTTQVSTIFVNLVDENGNHDAFTATGTILRQAAENWKVCLTPISEPNAQKRCSEGNMVHVGGKLIRSFNWAERPNSAWDGISPQEILDGLYTVSVEYDGLSFEAHLVSERPCLRAQTSYSACDNQFEYQVTIPSNTIGLPVGDPEAILQCRTTGTSIFGDTISSGIMTAQTASTPHRTNARFNRDGVEHTMQFVMFASSTENTIQANVAIFGASFQPLPNGRGVHVWDDHMPPLSIDFNRDLSSDWRQVSADARESRGWSWTTECRYGFGPWLTASSAQSHN